MALNPHPIYPSAGRYVLRLHQASQPSTGYLAGRIEHVTSGDSSDFDSGAELLAWLARPATAALPGTPVSRIAPSPKKNP